MIEGMSKKFIDLTGQKFERLTVVKYHGKIGTAQMVAWQCMCDCGKAVIVSSGSLKTGKQKSCGCFRKEFMVVHGGYKLPVFRIWATLKQRCLNPKAKGYENYGGRGIKVCESWLEFENFFADMGHKPKGMSIDRIDSNGNYEPSNCRWATGKTQGQNKRNNHMLTAFGQTKSRSAFADEYKLSYNTLVTRLKLGWDIEKALLEPVTDKFKNKLAKT